MWGVRSQSNFPRIASRFFMPLKIGDCSDDCRNSIGKNVRDLRAGLGKKRRMPFQPFPASGKPIAMKAACKSVNICRLNPDRQAMRYRIRSGMAAESVGLWKGA
ncbi:hypothetical protein U0E10_08705 [Burkholderia ubonensis]|uniref:hypothetical protein n=1 Tax=Burkholderia ubonensis TaxID=101571 RepID=UPI002AB35ACD|nr:hypothetical protein [Burkholderia ubonensis]MDY7787989.1 hypothetical protein [Burkholderia ubonensis]